MARILVVDPERSYCESLNFLLSQQGHEVRVASNASDGSAIGEAFQPQLLITEWMLKGNCCGDELGERLRSLDPGLRVIIMTGWLDATDDAQLKGRCDRIVQKPFHADELLEVIRQLLEPTHSTEGEGC